MPGRRYYLTTLAAWRRHAARFAESHWVAADASAGPDALGDAAAILALVDADEGAHLALECDAAFEALPHPLARAAVSARAAGALASHGVRAGDDTFAAAEKISRAHPLLRHRVF